MGMDYGKESKGIRMSGHGLQIRHMVTGFISGLREIGTRGNGKHA